MKNSEETRQKIVNAALDLFANKGYAGTSINDIISEIKISKGAVYWHFKSKEDIFIQIISENYNQWIALVSTELKHIDNPIEKLKRYGELFIETVEFPIWRISPETYWNEFSIENKKILDKYFSWDKEKILEIIKEAKERDLLKFNDLKRMMWIYISSLEGMFEKVIIAYKNDDGTLEELKDYASSAISLYLDSITK